MSETILDTIAAYARKRVLADIEVNCLGVMQAMAQQGGYGTGQAFTDALKKPGMSFICEVKKASPSKGVISQSFPYLDIAKAYEAAGADAISCLTEPQWFLGSDDIFREIHAAVSTPMLRKDFTVDQYQIYQAKVMGASAVLLICAILDTRTIAQYLDICHQLGLAALVEAHDEAEISSAVSAGAEIIGVNNRNLKDFSVNFDNAARLRDQIPPNCLYVAESGVHCPEDVTALKRIGADAVLMGEVLMRANDKGAMLAQMREASR
jgi:indole-3-glycerol phosphate synthase